MYLDDESAPMPLIVRNRSEPVQLKTYDPYVSYCYLHL